MSGGSLGRGKRLEQIVAVLGKYGLAGWLPDSGPDLLKGLLKSQGGEELTSLSGEARIRLALAELGPTYIKLGQMVSTRTDLITPELAEELSKLQADTPADPMEAVRGTIESELDGPIDALFADFDGSPMASASIAQAHRATLHDGRSVVVKVQHPDIEGKVERDLEMLGYLAGLAERHSAELRAYQPQALVAEFRRSILRELDFEREALNLERFRGNFADDASVRIPYPIRELTSHRVLTMELLDGIALSHVERLAEAHVDTGEVARRGANLYLEMIFRDGLYHADPHPGNILVMSGGVIGLIDFGRVGMIDQDTRHDFEDLVIAAVEGDPEQLTYVITRLCKVPVDLDDQALRVQVAEFVADHLNVPLERIDLTAVLIQMMGVIRTHRLTLPSSLSMLIKVLVQLEGTSRLLTREFNLTELLQHYYARAVSARWAPQRLAQAFRRSYRDWSRFVDMLPRNLTDLIERARAGSLDVNLQHRHLDTVVNRLVHGVLTAALVIGSAQLLSQRVGPTIWGMSALGLLFGIAAAVLGLPLLWAIRRSGGL